MAITTMIPVVYDSKQHHDSVQPLLRYVRQSPPIIGVGGTGLDVGVSSITVLVLVLVWVFVLVMVVLVCWSWR